jgi:hypothetical protein
VSSWGATATNSSGPTTFPVRITPPNSDRARPRANVGATRLRWVIRTRLHTAQPAACTNTDAPRSQTDRAARHPTNPAIMAPAAIQDDRHSPNRATIRPAGRSNSSVPTPLTATIMVASAGEACTARAA